ncbi:hypothetical protein BC941DRAFT_475562 [Chlamydoabsidia padenii]|nr:hypothetical protein BC941DRAFT_475562 [Chlamydoabsidia padenii]
MHSFTTVCMEQEQIPGIFDLEFLILKPPQTIQMAATMAFGTFSKRTPKTTSLKQQLKRWIGWGSKKTQQQHVSSTLNTFLPVVDEAIYDDMSSSSSYPKPSQQNSSTASIKSIQQCTSQVESTRGINTRSWQMDDTSLTRSCSVTSSYYGTIKTEPPIILLNQQTLSTTTYVDPLPAPCDTSSSDLSSLLNSVLDHDTNMNTEVEEKDNTYLVYEWPSDDDDEGCQDNSTPVTIETDQLATEPHSTPSMHRSTTCYFECISSPSPHHLAEDPVDQDLSSGSNSSFFSTNSTFTISHNTDDSALLLDTDALLLVTHGEEFLKSRENTYWEDNDKQSLAPSPSTLSGLTLVNRQGDNSTLLILNKVIIKNQNDDDDDDDKELHRLVNTHILF